MANSSVRPERTHRVLAFRLKGNARRGLLPARLAALRPSQRAFLVDAALRFAAMNSRVDAASLEEFHDFTLEMIGRLVLELDALRPLRPKA